MDDRERRDKALIAYIKAVLDEPDSCPDEEILQMFHEGNINAKIFIDDMDSRIKRIARNGI